jgi:O-antigen ligase
LPFFLEVMTWVARSGPDFFHRSMAVAHFSHVRHFGYLGFLAAMAATALVTLPGRFGLTALLLAGCALFGVIATGSRGALLSWLVFVLLLVCFSPARWRVLAFCLAALAGSALLVGYLHFSGLLVSPNIFVRVQQLVTVQGVELGSGRMQIWHDALGVIVRHPLFGMGTEAYRITGCCDRRVAQPHNFVLQLLMQFGLVGSGLLAALCWRALRALGGARRVAALVLASPENLALAAMLAAFLAFSCIDGLLYREVPLIHFAVLCGLFAAGLHRAREASRRTP